MSINADFVVTSGFQDGILESYWGEHIHLGYYDEEERKKVRDASGCWLSCSSVLPMDW